VGAHELSPEHRDRLRETVSSHEELQVLLFARRHGATWSREEAAGSLHLAEPALDDSVDALLAAGFLQPEPGGLNGERRLRYAPASPDLADLVDRVAEVLETNPLHLFELMNQHALERVRSSVARTFASAFVLGRKKDG